MILDLFCARLSLYGDNSIPHGTISFMEDVGGKRVENISELREKRTLLQQLDQASRALALASSGNGMRGQPNAEQRVDLANASSHIEKVRADISSRPLEKTDSPSIATTMMFIKAGLASYLSDEQFIQIFGTDNLA